MHDLYIARIKKTLLLAKTELYCHFLCLIGYVKARVLLDKKNVNKVEIGSGAEKRAGFLTLDLSHRTDFPYDLTVGLPFPDNSLDLVYAEHVLEHFSHGEFAMLLRESYRTLKPGGKISIVVPDPRIYINGYLDPDKFDIKRYCDYRFSLELSSPIQFLNYIFYMDGHHHYMTTPEDLQIALRQAGFHSANSRPFDPDLDLQARQKYSIYAEATK